MLEKRPRSTFILEPANIVFDPATKEAKGGRNANAKWTTQQEIREVRETVFRSLSAANSNKNKTYEAKANTSCRI